jgi:glycerate kinase
MVRVLLCFDSFKDSVSAEEVSSSVGYELAELDLDGGLSVSNVNVSDGGEASQVRLLQRLSLSKNVCGCFSVSLSQNVSTHTHTRTHTHTHTLTHTHSLAGISCIAAARDAAARRGSRGIRAAPRAAGEGCVWGAFTASEAES